MNFDKVAECGRAGAVARVGAKREARTRGWTTDASGEGARHGPPSAVVPGSRGCPQACPLLTAFSLPLSLFIGGERRAVSALTSLYFSLFRSLASGLSFDPFAASFDPLGTLDLIPLAMPPDDFRRRGPRAEIKLRIYVYTRLCIRAEKIAKIK